MIEIEFKATSDLGPVRRAAQTFTQHNCEEAGRFVRRTQRKAIGQRRPRIAVEGRYFYFPKSAPGEPIYKVSGFAYENSGFDRLTGEGGGALVTVSEHGWEIGKDGVKRPSLAPVLKDNETTIRRIMAGAQGAPDCGDIGRAAHRLPPPRIESREDLVRYLGKHKILPGWNKGMKMGSGFKAVRIAARYHVNKRA